MLLYKHQDLQELIQMNAPLFSAYLSLPNVHFDSPLLWFCSYTFNMIILTLIILTLTTINNPNKTSYYSQYNIIFPKKITQKNTPSQILSYSFCFARRRFPKSNYIYPIIQQILHKQLIFFTLLHNNTKPPLFSPLLSVLPHTTNQPPHPSAHMHSTAGHCLIQSL